MSRASPTASIRPPATRTAPSSISECADGPLTAESTSEQASAGLDRLAPEELRRFAALNGAYRARFGMPFIMAVKGKSKADILAAFQLRLGNDADAETTTALAEVDRIAALRLKDILP